MTVYIIKTAYLDAEHDYKIHYNLLEALDIYRQKLSSMIQDKTEDDKFVNAIYVYGRESNKGLSKDSIERDLSSTQSLLGITQAELKTKVMQEYAAIADLERGIRGYTSYFDQKDHEKIIHVNGKNADAAN